MKNKLTMIVAMLFTAQTVFAAATTDNNYDIGKTTATADKSITFQGPVKKKINSTQTGIMSYNGNSLLLGDGANTANKVFQFNKGASSPYLQYNFSTGGLETGNETSVSHNGSILSFGDGANTNKTLKFNKGASSPEIRYNSSTAKLEFSNDASLYKAIGSGTGSGGDGGVNLSVNPGFEDGSTIDWTSSGGTYSSQTYANPTDANTKFVRLVASGSGQYFESLAKTVPTFFGIGCMANLKYNQSGQLFTMSVIDGSANVLATQTVGSTVVTAWTKTTTLAYPCPAVAGTLKLRVTSTGAGTIDVDDAYFGSNQNLSQIAQAQLFAEVAYSNGGGSSTTSATFVDTSATGTGAAYSNSSVPTGNRLGLTIPYMPAGRYMIVGTGFQVSAGSTATNSASYASFAATDIATATICGFLSTQGNVNGQTDVVAGADMTCMYTVTSPLTNKEFWVKQKALTGTVGVNAQAGGKISVYYFPTTAQTAYTPDQSSWLIDVNIGGGNASISSINSTYTEFTSANFDLVINTAKGSANAEIACANGNVSTGLTCSASNESAGIAFIPPYAGQFEVCLDYEISTVAGHASAQQLIETPNSSTTILQEGGARQQLLGAASGIDFPLRTCGTFVFNDTSKRTIRLMYESQDTTAFSIIADRSSGLGQRDMKWTVRPILQNIARPVLVGNQVTSNTNNIVLEAVTVDANCTTSPCTMVRPTVGIASVTRTGTGSYSINFVGGVYSVAPHCSALAKFSGGAQWAATNGAATTTSHTVNILNTSGSVADGGFVATCVGQK